jgi:hypothetical protein
MLAVIYGLAKLVTMRGCESQASRVPIRLDVLPT